MYEYEIFWVLGDQTRFGEQMIHDGSPILQALVASLFTWGVTALGAAVVFFLPPHSKKLLG